MSHSEPVKKLIARGKKRGLITFDQLNDALSPDEMTSEQIEEVMAIIEDLGINIVEDEESATNEEEKGDEVNLPSKSIDDLILGGELIRIARLPPLDWPHWGMLAARHSGMSSRLVNRYARENAIESRFGFAQGSSVDLLNHCDLPQIAIPACAGDFGEGAQVFHHQLLEDEMLVLTKAAHWWAELQLEAEFDPENLTFRAETHVLPDDSRITLHIPAYDGKGFHFGCPPAPQSPDRFDDQTTVYNPLPRDLGCASMGIAPILDRRNKETRRFRTAYLALIQKLEDHGVYAWENECMHSPMYESWEEPTASFAIYAQVNASSNIASLAINTIDSFDDENDILQFTAVEWLDTYELRRRVSLPEVYLGSEVTSAEVYCSAKSLDTACTAIRLAQSLAEECRLVLSFYEPSEGDRAIMGSISLAAERRGRPRSRRVRAVLR